MSQHDFNIANQSFPATRTDLNNALQALASNSSGDAEPSTTFANQWWYETDTNTLKLRNEANNAWLSFATVDQSTAAWTLAHDVTVSNGLTVSGAFTSLGIDDNATSNAITIDSSENVGVGMTPVASYGLLQVGSAVTSALGVGGLQAYVAGTNSALGQNGNVSIVTTDGQAANIGGSIGLGGKFVAAGTSVLFAQISGRKENSTDNNSAGYLQFATQPNGGTPLERLRISSTGNVGIGTTSPSTQGLHILSSAGVGAISQPYATLNIENSTGDPMMIMSGTSGGIIASMNNSQAATPLRFYTGQTERMRIKSTGDIQIGTAIAGANLLSIFGVSGSKNGISIMNSADSSPVYSIFFNNAAGALIGSITNNGSSTAYNTSSDYRLKEDLQLMSGASERVLALKPINFAWISTGERVDGFLAHELAEVVPEAVVGTKDAMRDEEYEVTAAVYEDIIIAAVLDEEGNEIEAERTEQRLVTEAVMGTRSVPDYQGIDQSKLVPLLTAALQEALTKISALEARVAALEA
jgi:hypothetical protein